MRRIHIINGHQPDSFVAGNDAEADAACFVTHLAAQFPRATEIDDAAA